MVHGATKRRAVLLRHWPAFAVWFLVPASGIGMGALLSHLAKDTGGWGDLVGMVAGLLLGSTVTLVALSAFAARRRGWVRASCYGVGGAVLVWLGLVIVAWSSMTAWTILVVLAASCGYVVFAGRSVKTGRGSSDTVR
jgi:hypothetical protein